MAEFPLTRVYCQLCLPPRRAVRNKCRIIGIAYHNRGRVWLFHVSEQQVMTVYLVDDRESLLRIGLKGSPVVPLGGVQAHAPAYRRTFAGETHTRRPSVLLELCIYRGERYPLS